MSIANLAAALVKAQSAMGGAKKDSSNPFFKSKYADLASVDAAISGPASENGLSYVQIAHERDNAAAIETVIVHSSGETLSCGIVSVPVAKSDAQGFGSALTYARRYSLAAAFGVCPEDDDGNAAAKAPPRGSPAEVKKDAFDSLPEAMQKKLVDFSLGVREAIDRKNMPLAFERYELYKDGLDDTEQIAFWALFKPNERAAIKAHGETVKNASGLAPANQQPA